jgi:predicted TIM-barrel fold metal-dependent hydrolase
MTTTALNDVWMISVDDHLIEPPNVWLDRLPAKFRDRGPRWITDDLGEAWLIDDDVRVAVNGAVVAAAFLPPAEKPPPFQPMAWSQIPPNCYDPLARAEAMDIDHVIAALPFPNLPGFAGRVFQNLEDKELALLCIQAYNDWIIDEFAAAIPGRIIEVALIPMWDGQLAAQEAERVIAKGACSVSFSMAPHKVGFPPIHDEHWDPLYSVMSDADLPLCTHLGTGFETDPGLMVQQLHKKREEPSDGEDFRKVLGLGTGNGGGGRERPMHPAIGAVIQLSGQETLIDWLTSGNFDRYPNLKVALSENGIGWIPSVLQAADVLVETTRARITTPMDAENNPLLTEEERQKAQKSIDARAELMKDMPLPSEVFRDHIYGCFIHDPLGLKLIDEMGVDNIMIETDFPHFTSWWPHSIEQAMESLQSLDDDVRDKVLRRNAERVFKFTPAEPPAMTGQAAEVA